MRRGSAATLAALASLTVVGTALPATASAAANGTRAATASAPGSAVRATGISAHGIGVVAPPGALSGHGGPAQAALAMVAARHRLAASRARRPSTVTGVVRAFTGLPVAGACVTAYGSGGSAAARTSAAGRFSLRGLRAGRYTLEFRDCARPGRYLPQWSGGAPAPAMARPLLVSGGTTTQVAPVTLRPASQAALFARPAATALARAAGLPAAAAAA